MEEQFVSAWMQAREQARALGVRLRPLEPERAMQQAHRCLRDRRESDGFNTLADRGHLELTLEALVVDRRFTALFDDEQANTALTRLLNAGYFQEKPKG